MPLSELYNAVDPRGVVLNANLFSNNSYPGTDVFPTNSKQFPNAYRFAKTFVSPSSVVFGGGNGVTSIDDPTYLGFSLRFDILSPLFNGAILNNPSQPKLGDRDFSFINDLDGSRRSGKDPSRPNGESAVGYLEAIGETTRANYLRAFIQGIREVNSLRPYYWQTITGLDEAWNKSFQMEDPYSGTTDEQGININCLEALDLKISALFNLYKAAVFDVKYKRTILPKNLMYFNIYIDVLEIREFKTFKRRLERDESILTAENRNSNRENTLKLINENTATITFLFEDCIWDLSAANKIFETVSNNGTNEMTTSSMKWSYSKVEIESQFPGYDSALSDSANLQPANVNSTINTDPRSLGKKILDNATEAAKGSATTTLSNLKKGVVNKVERVAKSLIQKPLLGNIFGQRNQILAAIRNPQFLVNAVAGAAVQSSILSSNTPQVSGINRIGNSIFTNQTLQNEQSLTSNNVFGRGPSGPSPLNSTNVFE